MKKVRHPPGTWTVWEKLWFYATKTKGLTDMKVWVRWQFRRVDGGMGDKGFSKTAAPKHFGDSWENPWRALLVLRAWAVWRASQGGWADARPCRARELAAQVERLTVELKFAQGGLPPPLLGSAKAHDLMVEWVPAVVGAVFR